MIIDMKKHYGSIVLIIIGLLNLLLGFLAKIETWAFVIMIVFWAYVFIATVFKLINSNKA